MLRNDGSLNIDEIARRIAIYFKITTDINQSNALLDLCKKEKGIDAFKCLKDNSERVGFNKALLFDPLKELNVSLADIFDRNSNEIYLSICNNRTGIKLLQSVDVFVRF